MSYYRGRPSSACKPCRDTRAKCDLLRPQCTQCRNKGVNCHGYRNTADLMWLDETKKTRERARQSSSRTPGVARASPSSSNQAVGEIVVPPIRDQFNRPSQDEFALSYAYRHHIVHPDPASNVSLFVKDAKLLMCMRALGMATYATFARSTKLELEAQKYHRAAETATYQAIMDPVKALEDGTLLALIALTYYESIAGKNIHSIQTWARHIRGTAYLIHRRGPAQVDAPTGRLLFIQACTPMLANCLRCGIRVPRCVHKLVNCDEFRKDPRWPLLDGGARLCDLKSDIIKGRITDLSEIIGKARVIDQKCFDYNCLAPYRVHPLPTRYGSELPAYMLEYSDAWSAMHWNAVRVGRIICNGIISEMLTQQAAINPDSNYDIEIYESQEQIQQMHKDILASIPQYLGMTGVDPQEAERLTLPVDDDGVLQPRDNIPATSMSMLRAVNLDLSHLPIMRTSRGYVLCINLANAARLAPLDSEIRLASCKYLEEAGRLLGMSQATIYADALRENRISDLIIDPRLEDLTNNDFYWISSDGPTESDDDEPAAVFRKKRRGNFAPVRSWSFDAGGL